MRMAPLVLPLLLLACSGGFPGGGSGPAAGGGGGSGEPGGAGGTGGPWEDPAYVAEFPGGLDVSVRSQLFAATFEDGLLPSGQTVLLLEEPRACTSPGGLRLDEGEAWISLSVYRPSPGDCAVVGLGDIWEPPAPPPDGCHAYVTVARRGFATARPRTGSLRLDYRGPDTLAGVLSLVTDSLPVSSTSCGHGGGGGECECHGPDGPFECTYSGPRRDCCYDGLEPVEVSVSFEAARCDTATQCAASPCAPELAASCPPEVPPIAPCEEACAAYLSTCESCRGCAPGACGEHCDEAGCLAICRSLGAVDPVVALSLACSSTTSGCDEWATCVASCGPP
jgi:hypothetical protein